VVISDGVCPAGVGTRHSKNEGLCEGGCAGGLEEGADDRDVFRMRMVARSSRKWQAHVRRDGAAHEMEIRTI